MLVSLGMVLVIGVACNDPIKPHHIPDQELSAVTQDQGTDVGCVADCEGRVCGVDPRCGFSCGTCTETQTCEAAQCVDLTTAGQEMAGQEVNSGGVEEQGGENAQTCTPSCESAAAQCGELCGRSCGVCEQGERCEDHQCVCVPQCAGKSCEEDNGCGGTCTPCPRSESCTGCALRLRVIGTSEAGGQVNSAQVALSLDLPEGVPLPQIADIHLKVTGPVILGRVGLGTALVNANKQLIPDPATGLPYRHQGNIYSFMVLSTQNSNEISSGDWLIFDLQIGSTNEAPVTLQVVEREQTFAPPAADLQLWGASLGEGLVLWPALSQGE